MRRGYLHRASWAQRKFGKNIGTPERWISMVGALALAFYGRRRGKHRQVAAAAATFLMRRGVTGRCPLYTRLALSTN